MFSCKVVHQSQVNLPSKWKETSSSPRKGTVVNATGRPVNHTYHGARYQVVCAAQHTNYERIKRCVLGVLAMICTFGSAWFLFPRVKFLFSKKCRLYIRPIAPVSGKTESSLKTPEKIQNKIFLASPLKTPNAISSHQTLNTQQPALQNLSLPISPISSVTQANPASLTPYTFRDLRTVVLSAETIKNMWKEAKFDPIEKKLEVLQSYIARFGLSGENGIFKNNLSIFIESLSPEDIQHLMNLEIDIFSLKSTTPRNLRGLAFILNHLDNSKTRVFFDAFLTSLFANGGSLSATFVSDHRETLVHFIECIHSPFIQKDKTVLYEQLFESLYAYFANNPQAFITYTDIFSCRTPELDSPRTSALFAFVEAGMRMALKKETEVETTSLLDLLDQSNHLLMLEVLERREDLFKSLSVDQQLKLKNWAKKSTAYSAVVLINIHYTLIDLYSDKENEGTKQYLNTLMASLTEDDMPKFAKQASDFFQSKAPSQEHMERLTLICDFLSMKQTLKFFSALFKGETLPNQKTVIYCIKAIDHSTCSEEKKSTLYEQLFGGVYFSSHFKEKGNAEHVTYLTFSDNKKDGQFEKALTGFIKSNILAALKHRMFTTKLLDFLGKSNSKLVQQCLKADAPFFQTLSVEQQQTLHAWAGI